MRRLIVVLGILGTASMACAIGGGALPEPTAIVVQPTVAQPTLAGSTATPTTDADGGQTPAPPGQNCTPRSDWPIYTVDSGDTLASIAARTSSNVSALTAANCLTNANALLAGQQLRVPEMPSSLPTPTSDQCPGNISWFFSFAGGTVDRLCPNPVETRNAAGEDFEGGRMLWYSALPGESDQRPTIYVIYNDGDWETIPDVWDSSQPASDPSIVPPANRFQPTNSLGKVWRENSTIRGRLGWAYEPMATFTGHVQSVVEPNPRPAGYIFHWYMDHGKQGIVLRLYSIDMAPNKWEVAGKDQ